MDSKELRQRFLDFFAKNGHEIVPSSSLLPADPSVLFTTAGMQQFKPYYLGEESPFGKNTASCQKCIRTSDIDEVGDESHLTFFEMLGNFSFGGYFKKEAIKYGYDFIVKELGLEIDYVTIFDPSPVAAGDWRKGVPPDEDSYNIWKGLGIAEEKIKREGIDNFWGPTGEEGPCGPTTEIYVKNKEGKSIEIWNIVFNEYFCNEQKELKKLETPGVDTGMGFERLAVMVQKKNNVFETDLFSSILDEINSKVKTQNSKLQLKIQNLEKVERIIADHTKASVFIASEGVFPSNVERGYVLRRILRRAIRYGKILDLPSNHSTRAKLGAGQGFLIPLAKKVVEIYQDVYPEIKSAETDVLTVIQQEEEKFEKTLEKGLKILNREMRVGDISPVGKIIKEIPDLSPIDGFPGFTPLRPTGKWFFNLYQTFGFPLELSLEELKNRGKKFSKSDLDTIEKEFEEEVKKHQKISRAGVETKFGGGGEFSPKLHTATHLLHAALRQVLGPNVKQMGSDITAQRLRFDFVHNQKMTSEEIKKVEDIVNQKIKEDLEVKKEEMKYEDAIKSGALAFFKEKYPEKVSVYSVGDPSASSGQVFSKEICAGPHIQRTSELGRFKITKEESSGAGVRRIRAVLE